MSNQDSLQAIIDAAPSIENSNFILVSTAAWFIWDWVVSFDLEVHHFWGKKPFIDTLKTVGSCLYFSNRIVGVIIFLLHFYEDLLDRRLCYSVSLRPQKSAASAEACKPIVYVILILGGISGFIVQSVLVLRTYALWDCRKDIFWLLMSLNVLASLAQQGVIITLWRINGLSIPWNPLPAPYTGTLVKFNVKPWNRYVPILAFELVIVLFMVAKFADHGRRGRSHRVIYVLFRDAVSGMVSWSFHIQDSRLSNRDPFVVSSLLSLLIGVFGSGSSRLANITFNVVAAISLICCARLLLNIRDVMTLSDPRDTTKPNPWSLSPSFDEQYGDTHVSRSPTFATSDPNQIEMFDTFFRDSEHGSQQYEARDGVTPMTLEGQLEG
ncbi:hypothetical protein DL93DRAFT_2160879 [Clavulina sp. PMI_390]|nr:hypothetical protein DL93DRAFT_2160879 [Clavulina sp. PMI_390]